MTEKEKLNEEYLAKQALIKTVDMDAVFNSVENIYFDKKLQNEILYTLDEYKDYLIKLDELNPMQLKQLLDNIKFDETIVTQLFDNRDELSLVRNIYDNHVRIDSIDYIMDKVIGPSKISGDNLKYAHSIIMEGSIDKEKITEEEMETLKRYRDNDKYWVGAYNPDNTPNVQYFPPSSKTISDSIDKIVDFINDDIYHNTEFDLFVHPIIGHALIAILQPFGDGNTRLSRLIQSSYFTKNTNNVYDTNYQLPLLALSTSYYGFREQYRELIKDIALNPCSETWTKWIMFNLRTIQCSIDNMYTMIEKHMKIGKTR